MKRNKVITNGLLIIFILCSPQVWAKKFSLSGSGALSMTQTNINNCTIDDIPPDLTIGLEYQVNGRLENLDVNSSIELNFNKRDDDWDEIVKSFTFGISNPKRVLNLGDLYEDISDFTLSDDTSIQFGLKLNQDIKFGEKSEVLLIGGRIQEASVYESDENENGMLDSDEDKNNNAKWDYGYSYYDQWLCGVRFSSSLTKNTFLGITYLKINDDKNSREERGTVTTLPIKNDVFGLDSAVSFFNHFLIVSGELTRSSYEKIGSVTNHDKAYQISLSADKKNWNFDLGYTYIGTNYFSGGSPYLKTDKKGYFVKCQWLPTEIFRFTLEGEVFNDNLINDLEYPITETKIIVPTFELKPENFPQITLKSKLTDEKSDKYTSSYPQLDRLTKDISLEISHSIKETNLILSLQRTKVNDQSIDSYGTEYEDSKSDVLSLIVNTVLANKFTLSNYHSYIKNKIGNDKDDIFNTTIDVSYEVIPQKLVFKPRYEFEEYRVGKKCRSKEFSAKMEVDYYLSTASQFSFAYERKKNEDKENTATNYKADVGILKYTRLF